MTDFNHLFDFRLLDISLEIDSINSHFTLLERQVVEVIRKEKEKVENILKEENLSYGDPEWHEMTQMHEIRIHAEIPRFFWNPFLISIYAVFESAVIEISEHIRTKKKIEKTLKDIPVRTFLKKAKKYYQNELEFTLFMKKSDWENVKILSDLRNAIAHSNARIEPLSEALKKRIYRHAEIGDRIVLINEYFIVEKDYAKSLLESVQSILKDLVYRYKKWDSQNESA